MNGLAVRLVPYALAFCSSLCIMVLELVASRLVVRHVGMSLDVWTSVIGVMLGGICLGNVLGGRLADGVAPRRAVGPLFAIATALTLGCLWANAYVGLTPGLDAMPWNLRTLVVVTLDFLIPATVLGMVSPVVAKLAVEQSKKAGSAIGDVYFLGAVGSIVGTFLAGFVLIYEAPTSAIVTVVAAALALLAALLLGNATGFFFGVVTSICLGLGSIAPLVRSLKLPGFSLGSITSNPIALTGHALAVMLALIGLGRLNAARRAFLADPENTPVPEPLTFAKPEPATDGEPAAAGNSLTTLCALSFVASLAFMALEMDAGRLVQRHLGSSLYGWTSVIGVLLGGLSLGNYLGGKLADHISREKQASWLFLIASVLVVLVLRAETPPKFIYEKMIGHTLEDGEPIQSLLSRAIWMTHLPGSNETIPLDWPARVLIVTALMFFLPALAMGTVSPVVVKLAVERLRNSKRTGRAIGQVYAWGMVGSILGTFLTGFVLIDVLGTKGVLLVVCAMLAVSATILGGILDAIWAGVPLGLCIIAFTPVPKLEALGQEWGVREERGDPETKKDNEDAWVDESNYYYIKVTNEAVAEGFRRTVALDHLIHGYFILGHPERLDYDYEHIYALVTYRIAEAKMRAAGDLAAVNETRPAAPTDALPTGKTETPKASAEPKSESKADPKNDAKPAAKAESKKDAAPTPKRPYPPDLSKAKLRTLFLGGGAYTFPRYLQDKYKGTQVDVAEIDPAVTKANLMATGLKPEEGPIVTTWGDARQFVENNQGKKQYDVIFGDAFNDFSVPWHLTTREFNDKLANLLAPNGVYMINIIDVYESEATAQANVEKALKKEPNATEERKQEIRRREEKRMLEYGGFLGSWVKTAKLTFPYIYIYGTNEVPGHGLRETFVVVASKSPVDLKQLGGRDDDPQFFQHDRLFEPEPFGDDDCAQVDVRSRGIVLTDDYAPVENLLAPVAKTRGDAD